MFYSRLGSLALALLSLLVLAMAPLNAAAEWEPPPGFRVLRRAPGVTLYRKDYPGGSPDFVQRVDLAAGAGVLPLHGALTAPRSTKGVFGGPDPRLRSQSLAVYWQAFSKVEAGAFCVTNGQFFYMPEYPTRLPFALKVDGEVVTEGYDNKHHLGLRLMLELWPGRASISPLSQESFYASSAPHIVAGLSEDANKRAPHYTGRTFVGVDDPDQDGSAQIILIFNSRSARQVDAARVLRDFGADQVMMLDGGGSTQLLCQGKNYVPSERLLPQVLGIYAAPAGGDIPQASPPVAALPPEEAQAPPPAKANPAAEALQPIPTPVVTSAPTPGGDTEPAHPGSAGQPSQLQARQAALRQPVGEISLGAVLWVPLAMLPVAGIVLALIFRTRYPAA